MTASAMFCAHLIAISIFSCPNFALRQTISGGWNKAESDESGNLDARAFYKSSASFDKYPIPSRERNVADEWRMLPEAVPISG